MEQPNNNVCIVLCTCPDSVTAERLSREIVEGRLAACVNIIPGIQSVFRWEGKVQSESETLLVIKTVRGRYAELEASLQAAHPYDVPEILLIPVGAGLPAYLEWVSNETE